MAIFSIYKQSIVVMQEKFLVEAKDEETARKLVLQGDVEPDERNETEEHSHEIIFAQNLEVANDN